MSLKKQIIVLVTVLIVSLVSVTQVEEFLYQRVVDSMRVNLERNINLIRRLVLIDMHHEGVNALVYKDLYYRSTDQDAKRDLEEYRSFVATMHDHVNFVFQQRINDEFITLKDSTLSNLNEFTAMGETIISTDFNDAATSKRALEKFDTLFTKLEVSLERLSDVVEDHANRQQSQIADTASTVKIFTRLGSLSVAFLCLLFSIKILRRFSKNLKETEKSLDQNNNDIARVVESMRKLAGNLSEVANLSSSAVHETSASMSEFRSLINQTTQLLQQGNALTQEGDQQAQDSMATVNRLTASLNELDRVREELNRIPSSMQTVKTNLSSINDIVFKTQLISFNASIEAARAGSEGKGFSVVADEVGVLATNSGALADKIVTLVEEVNQNASTLTNNLTKKVEQGIMVGGECYQAFEILKQYLSKLGEMSEQLSSASKEQTIGVEQVQTAMQELAQTIDQNLRISEDIKKNSDQLFRCANSLEAVVTQVKKLAA